MTPEVTPEWLTVLLTEVSAAIHGRGSHVALEECVRNVPEEYLEAAGLRWALSSFDDQAPTAAQIDQARSFTGENPSPLADAIERYLNNSAWVASPRGIAIAVSRFLTNCRCPDPLRVVDPLCPVHGHSPEKA